MNAEAYGTGYPEASEAAETMERQAYGPAAVSSASKMVEPMDAVGITMKEYLLLRWSLRWKVWE